MVDPELVPYAAAILFALAFAGAVYALLHPYISGERQKDKRLQDVTSQQRRRGPAAADPTSSRKRSVADSLKDIEDRQKAKETLTMRTRLQRAGLELSPRDFYLLSAIAGLVIGGASQVFVGAPLQAAAVIAFIGALGLPRFILARMTKKRQQKFLGELANGIDVIVRGVKSGLPLNECLQVVARESPDPLGSEFREVVEQQRLGVPIGEGLERMCERMPLAEVRFLAIVVSIQQQAGGNLSEALSNLSGVLRDRFMLAMKVKALSAEAKASAIVLGSLPPGVMSMVYVTAPDYIMPLFTTNPGKFMLAGSACWMMCGILMMRKMINFKF